MFCCLSLRLCQKLWFIAICVIEMTLLPLHNQINLKSTNYYVIKVLLLVLRLFLEL